MDKRGDITSWPRMVAFMTIMAAGINLVLAGARPLALILPGFALFMALFPVWPWALKLPVDALFAIILVEGALVTVGLFGIHHAGAVVILFFVLIPTCGRLPRHYSLLCYVLFPLLACLPFIFEGSGASDWNSVISLVPGFLAIIVFTEAYTQVKRRSQETRKLLDELIAAQRRLQPESADGAGPAGDPAGAVPPLPFTRREREVLGLVAMGFSNKEIAERLLLAEGTVKNRVSDILEKMGVRDRTQAALRARELGIL